MACYEMEPYEFSVKEVFKDDNGDYHYSLITKEMPDDCPECGSEYIVRNGSKSKAVRDVNSFGGRVELIIDNPRFRCNDCGATFFCNYKSIVSGQRMTVRLRDYIKKQSLYRPFATLEDELGISDTTIKKLFAERIQELDAARELKAPNVLGIDENHLHKQYRAIFTDVEKGRILEILPNRSKAAVKAFIQSLPDYQDIRCFTMDMWKPYRDAVYELLPDAIVVIDKFHVVSKLNEALESMRKQLRSEQDKAERRKFRNSRFNFLKNMEDLDLKHQGQLLDFFAEYPEFEEPYYLKEEFRSIYDSRTKAEAVTRFENWKEKAVPYPAFMAVAETIDNWRREFFNYFVFRYTNAVTESLNRVINEIDRKGMGYTFDILRAKALYGTKATKPAKFKSISKWPNYSAGVYSFVTTIQSEAVLTEGWGVDIRELQAVLDAGNF